jgi:3-oxoacyl-[acyl-carrier protein] reductase
MPRKLEAKPRALVTGASRGIGAAIAKKLAADGFPVIVHYRTGEAAANAVADSIRAAGGVAELVQFDVTDGATSAAAIEKLLADPRPIGVLVNNAGVTADGPFPAMDREAWSKVIRTSLDGFYNVSGVIGNRGQVNYSAAKAGLIGATKALALEMAKRNVTVNAVAPGPVEGEMFDAALAQGTPLDEVLKHIPMRRIATADDVAAAVSFLASDAAGYITGQVLGVNGGMC